MAVDGVLLDPQVVLAAVLVIEPQYLAVLVPQVKATPAVIVLVQENQTQVAVVVVPVLQDKLEVMVLAVVVTAVTGLRGTVLPTLVAAEVAAEHQAQQVCHLAEQVAVVPVLAEQQQVPQQRLIPVEAAVAEVLEAVRVIILVEEMVVLV